MDSPTLHSRIFIIFALTLISGGSTETLSPCLPYYMDQFFHSSIPHSPYLGASNLLILLLNRTQSAQNQFTQRVNHSSRSIAVPPVPSKTDQLGQHRQSVALTFVHEIPLSFSI